MSWENVKLSLKYPGIMCGKLGGHTARVVYLAVIAILRYVDYWTIDFFNVVNSIIITYSSQNFCLLLRNLYSIESHK